MSIKEQLERRYGVTTETPNEVESNEVLNTILNHRSIRKFSDTPVDGSLIKSLLLTAFSAPSKSDLQQARVVWIKDKEKKLAIANLSPEVQGWIAEAPEFLVWCGDNSVCRHLTEEKNRPYSNNHLDQFMNPAVDAAIAMSTFLWAAESKGLGCCPVSSIRNTPFEVSEILNLPKFVFPIAGLAVGYPDKSESSKLSLRLPPEVLIIEDNYPENLSQRNSNVTDYSKRRNESQPFEKSKQRHIEHFGCSDSYDWSEDKSRECAVPSRTNWGEYIRQQGFLLD